MGELSIKLNIAGRIYPLTIDSKAEENIRKAARIVNDKVSEYETTYSVRDKQDPLAMCSLQMAVQNIEKENFPSLIDDSVYARLAEIDKYLTESLKQ